nr:glutamine--fructose-6-phosphate aminotransferase [isomerizing] 2 [Tanacetum cinerariifolium]
MCGIFAYLNYDVNRERRYILELLFNGLRRLEYRGYDSAGISIDADAFSGTVNGNGHLTSQSPLVFRQEGNIDNLVKSVYQGLSAYSNLEKLISSLFSAYEDIKSKECYRQECPKGESDNELTTMLA